jgi:ankyrin repeat protein
LQKGASATDVIDGMSPIEWAYSYGKPQVAEVLIKYGASPISKRRQNTLFFIRLAGNTLDKNRFKKMNALLEQGIDSVFIDDKNPLGETALMNACRAISFDHNEDAFSNISYLIEKGANINEKGKLNAFETREKVETKTTPLHVVVERTAWVFEYKKLGKKSICDIDEECDFCRLILEKMLKAGAYVSARDQFDRTPLHIAAIENNIIGATMLLEEECKVNDKDNSGKTPLDYAESAEMIKLLKDHGAKEQ